MREEESLLHKPADACLRLGNIKEPLQCPFDVGVIPLEDRKSLGDEGNTFVVV
jgi:hypothetical protein